MMKFYEADHYQPKVAIIIGQLKHDLDQTLKEARIEHIGSSAIVGATSPLLSEMAID